jgi:hypothetical protein
MHNRFGLLVILLSTLSPKSIIKIVPVLSGLSIKNNLYSVKIKKKKKIIN